MKICWTLVGLLLAATVAAGEDKRSAPIAIAIHGGAGTILKSNLTPDLEARIKAKLGEAARAGYAVLEADGSSLDAVQAAVTILEDSPLFNAGKGAVFNADGVNELDAAIMNGADLNAGAVAGLKHVKNPILAARKVMEASPHVLLIGDGGETFAAEQGLELVDPSYFYTDRRRQQLKRAQDKAKLNHDQAQSGQNQTWPDQLYSTVGAVALDKQGNLAAGTSTGGMTNKRWGRVGDVPIIGAGTYANNQSCAVSATGHGEYFIRSVVAYDICALMDYQDKTLAQATEMVVMKKLVERGGSGGVIALDPTGNISLRFNTAGMYRAAIDADGNLVVGIYQDPKIVGEPGSGDNSD